MASQNIHVLIIDDDPVDAMFAMRALSNDASGVTYVCRHVESLAEGIEEIAKGDFSIVLLDLGLPGFEFLETLHALRQEYRSIPVIVLTGHDDEDLAMQALESHAQDYLCKSDVNSRSLSRAIRYSICRQDSYSEIQRLLAEMREQQEALARKNDRLRRLYDTAQRFVDNVSHEFRTPLTVMKEYVSLVAEGMAGDVNDEQKHLLRIAEDRADDLNTMVDDMLDVSKIEAGSLSVWRKPCCVKQMFDRVLPSLQRKAQIKDLTLRVSVPKDLPQAFCDDEKIERVLINLIVNAMKFTATGGTVSLLAEEGDDDVVIHVEDDGQGIASKDLQTIFRRFEQVGTSCQGSTKGFGLGLNISKELIDMNLGAICVESELGSGSRFSIRLPKVNPLEVTSRYLARLHSLGFHSVSLLTLFVKVDGVGDNHAFNMERDPPNIVGEDFDAFLGLFLRSHDLAFRTDHDGWIVLLPASVTEAGLFIERLQGELSQANRNRPRGPLPDIAIQINDTWPEPQIAREEISARVHSLLMRNTRYEDYLAV